MNLNLFNIVIFLSFYLVLPIMFVMLRNETKPKKNILLGVTLPLDARLSSEAGQICRRLKRNLVILLAVMTLIGIGGFYIPYTSVFFKYELIWFLFAVTMPTAVYIRSHLKLKKLKTEKGWGGGYAGKTVVDLYAANIPMKKLSIWLFIPPTLISLIPPVYTACTRRGTDEFWYIFLTCLSFTLLVAVCYWLYRLIYRQSSEVVDDRTEITVLLTRIRRYNWGKCFIGVSWLTALYAPVFWLLLDSVVGILLSSGVYTAALLYVCMKTEFATRRMQEKLTMDSGMASYVDDDSHWIWGMFYYNENDSHLLKNSRIGINTTMNMARPAGKIILGLSALCLVALPLSGVWMMAEEFSPIRTEITEDQMVVSHLKTRYVVDYDEIISTDILEELPPMTRVGGTGLDNLCKGRFRADEYGICRLCLNPQSDSFLVVKTEEATYIFSPGAEELALFRDYTVIP
jgi:uncharacterized membrane protein